MQSSSSESGQIAEQTAPSVSGPAAVRHYIAMREKMPLASLGGSVHAIHGGTEYGAEISFNDLRMLLSMHDALVKALEEIETICTESAGDCRKRMGTRVGNALVAARAALAFAREVQP